MTDVAQIHSTSEPEDSDADSEAPRQRIELEETGFTEVPKQWRKFYRHWKGEGDSLAPNEVICPVCKVVIRSNREFRRDHRVVECAGSASGSTTRGLDDTDGRVG